MTITLPLSLYSQRHPLSSDPPFAYGKTDQGSQKCLKTVAVQVEKSQQTWPVMSGTW